MLPNYLKRFLSQIIRLTIFHLFWLSLWSSPATLSSPSCSAYLLMCFPFHHMAAKHYNTFESPIPSRLSGMNTVNTCLSPSHLRLKAANAAGSPDYFGRNRLKSQSVLKRSSFFLHFTDSLRMHCQAICPRRVRAPKAKGTVWLLGFFRSEDSCALHCSRNVGKPNNTLRHVLVAFCKDLN